MDGAENFFFVRGESDDLAFGIELRRILEEARRYCASCVLNAAVVIHSSRHLSCVQKSPVILSYLYAMMRMPWTEHFPKAENVHQY